MGGSIKINNLQTFGECLFSFTHTFTHTFIFFAPLGQSPDPCPSWGDGFSAEPKSGILETTPPATIQPKRFHGTVSLDPTRVGPDASQIADEVIAHLSGLMGAKVTVTLEIEAEFPDGATDNIVRTVTENSRTLKFTNHGFEQD